ncbi:MAG: hypothetical protein KAS32_15325 [Candidatus Peribacteraceae bacterium]|nr:hypothetical protein [Candidatus Peribacteraceae bacterium]
MPINSKSTGKTKNRTKSTRIKHPGIGQGVGGGRKPSIKEKQVAILVAAIENGFVVKEALTHAKIKKDAYYRKLKNDVKFRDRIEVADMKLKMKAKANMANAIRNGDMRTTRWFLERKVPEEFGRKRLEDSNESSNRNIQVILPGSRQHPRISFP